MNPTPSPHKPAHLPGLDSLRGFATLLVVTFHYAGLLPQRSHVDGLAWALTKGYVAVPLFFIISGFVVPYSMWPTYELRHFGRFLARRWLRLAPPFYAASALVVLASGLMLRGQPGARWLPDTPKVLHNLFFTVPFSNQDLWVVGAGWTLAIEWQFYLVLGLGFPWLFRHRRAGWWLPLLGLGGLALAGRWPSQFFILPHSGLLAMGGLTLLWRQGRVSTRHYLTWLAVFTGLTCLARDAWEAGAGALAALGLAAGLPRVPGLDFVGRISYSLYVLHMLLGRGSEWVLYRLLRPETDLGRYGLLSLCLAVCLAGATGFYYLVERPCHHLARRWAGR